MVGKILDADEMFEKWKAREEELAKLVYVEDGHIVINVHYEYNVALNRCDTPEKLAAWAYHLTEKTWMTTEVMRRFMEVAMAEHGFHLQV